MLIDVGVSTTKIVAQAVLAVALSGTSLGNNAVVKNYHLEKEKSAVEYIVDVESLEQFRTNTVNNEEIKIIDSKFIDDVIKEIKEEVELNESNEEIEKGIEKIRLRDEKKDELKNRQYKFVKDIVDGVYTDDIKSETISKGYDYEEVMELVEELTPKPVVTASSRSSSEPEGQPLLSSQIIPAYPHNTFKSYMRWTILSTSSPQGKLAAKATADPSTAIMKYNGRYLVALGFAYAGHIGEHIDIVMESGQVIPAIVGDWKAKEHTDANNSASLNNGSIVEFIVSSNEDANNAVNGSGNYNTIFEGNIKEFIK